jgi:hypothetical protein
MLQKYKDARALIEYEGIDDESDFDLHIRRKVGIL